MLSRTSSIISKRNGDCRRPCLAGIRRKTFNNSSLIIIFVISIFFIRLRKFPSLPSLLRVLLVISEYYYPFHVNENLF